jgi:hypothetical protein
LWRVVATAGIELDDPIERLMAHPDLQLLESDADRARVESTG